ncbi:MAG: phospholipase D-like domain-containing protein [Thermoguttaceae bacterium]|jgi:cardiolipin synthase
MITTWILAHLASVIGASLSILAIAHMLRQRRSPSSTAAWLLVIIAVPYLGVPLFLMFGGRKLRRRAESKDDLGLIARGEIPLEKSNYVDRTLRLYGIPGATAGNRMTLCATGVEGLQAMLQLVDEAVRSIHLETFIFSRDEVGQDVLHRLAKRAAEGLEVRLLVDGVGSLKTPRHFYAPFIRAGGKLAVFNPVLHIPFARRTNLRNHRKIAVADGQRALAGGMNISGEDMFAAPKSGAWQDLSFVVEGPAAWHFDQVFRSDWKFAMGENLDGAADCPPGGWPHGAELQVVPSGPDVANDPLLDTILMSIFSARQRVWIVTPYFVPDDTVAQALLVACHRGVDVCILVPEKSNHVLADIARGSFLRDIERAGGTIWQYTPGMLHGKLVIVDHDVAMVGSANMDMRSLLLNFEIMQFVYSKAEIDALEAWVCRLVQDSKAGMSALGAMREIIENLTRVVEPQL